ncbi:hypothetical protein QE152_g5291 [Popillia japonica]|uniref:Neuroligin n=1 Tax=Popillia japonica TaxID=7064 RepID=A0AAW1MRJ4_POPJA
MPSAATVDMKTPTRNHDEINTPFWDTYDTINQLYLELGNKAEIKNHYRGHKMSLWLNLIPQLHRPGDSDDVSMRHHHFQEEGDQFYDGSVRPQTMQKPALVHIIAPPPPASTAKLPPDTPQPTPLPPKSDTALQATTTECPPNTSIVSPSTKNINNNNLLRKLASSHYQSYTTALTVTIAVGCFLLLLNILIFAGIYHQRDKGRSKKKKKEELADAGSCSSSSGEAYETKAAYEARQSGFDSFKNPCELSRRSSFECKSMTNYIDEYSCEKRSLSEMTELPLQEFQSSPTPIKRHDPPSYPPDVTATNSKDNQTMSSPCLPEPPPPPKNQPPVTLCNQTGILRSHGGPSTPGTMKKRVQIQEISV